jgi:hypothetical protein
MYIHENSTIPRRRGFIPEMMIVLCLATYSLSHIPSTQGLSVAIIEQPRASSVTKACCFAQWDDHQIEFLGAHWPRLTLGVGASESTCVLST